MCPAHASGYIKEEVIDAAVEALLRRLCFDRDVIEWLRRALKESQEDQIRYREVQVDQLEKAAERLRQRLDRAYLDRLDGRITVEAYDSLAADWREELRRIEGQVDELQAADQDYHETGLGILELVRGAADLWLAQPPAEKRKLLKLLVSNFVIEAGEVKIELNQPFDLLLKTVDRAGEEGEAKWADLRTIEKWLRE